MEVKETVTKSRIREVLGGKHIVKKIFYYEYLDPGDGFYCEITRLRVKKEIACHWSGNQGRLIRNEKNCNYAIDFTRCFDLPEHNAYEKWLELKNIYRAQQNEQALKKQKELL